MIPRPLPRHFIFRAAAAAPRLSPTPSPASSAHSHLQHQEEEEEEEHHPNPPITPMPPSQSHPTALPTLPYILQPRVLIYDGVCHLCHRGVKWVIKTDKYHKIKFCCLQSRAAEPYLHLLGLHRQDVLRRLLFLEGPAAYYQGSTAALKVASYLPFPYSALSSLLIIPAPLRDAVYDYIAKNRYDWFGKEDKCIVMQEKELLEQFIDRDEMFGDGPGSSGTKFF